MPQAQAFGNGPDAVPDPNDQHAKNVQEMRMRMKAAHDQQQRQLAQRFRPFAHDPVDWEKRTTNKKNAVPDQNVASAVRQGEVANMQARGNLPRYGNSNLGAPQIIDALRMRGGVAPTAQQWGFPDRQQANPLELALSIGAARQHALADRTGLGARMAALAQAQQPVEQKPAPTLTPDQYNNYVRGSVASQKFRDDATARENAARIRMAADAGVEPSPENIAMLIRQKRAARELDLAARKSEVSKRAKAVGDVRKFGIAPQLAYALRGVGSSGQGETPEQRFARFSMMGMALEQAWEAANSAERANQLLRQGLQAGLAQASTPEAIDYFKNELEKIGGGIAPGSTLRTGLSQKDRDNAINEAIKNNPDDPMSAYRDLLQTEGITTDEALSAVRKFHPIARDQGFDPRLAETPWSGANVPWQTSVIAHFLPGIADWLENSPFEILNPDRFLPDEVRKRKRGIPQR